MYWIFRNQCSNEREMNITEHNGNNRMGRTCRFMRVECKHVDVYSATKVNGFYWCTRLTLCTKRVHFETIAWLVPSWPLWQQENQWWQDRECTWQWWGEMRDFNGDPKDQPNPLQWNSKQQVFPINDPYLRYPNVRRYD